MAHLFSISSPCNDPRVPWYVKGLTAFAVAHTFSPIDLIVYAML